MWASTRVTRPWLTAAAMTPPVPQAKATSARGQRAGVTTRPARYAAAVATGIPRTRIHASRTDAGERPSPT